MKKQLHEMTNKELGELFPIVIAKSDAVWSTLYCEEEPDQLLKRKEKARE